MECDCSCHERTSDGEPLAVHMIPCCWTCPTCHRNIHFAYKEEHTADCEAKLRKVIDSLKKPEEIPLELYI